MSSVLAGFLAGLSLIVAIGAQNAFVLRQGLRREHVGAVVATCIGADVLLIGAGAAGLGSLVHRHAGVLTAARYGGAAFMATLAVLAVRRAAHPERLDPAASGPTRLAPVLGTCLALTFLNPHVYLDTVVLLGALAGARPAPWAFAAGAGAASAAWFTALGFGAGRLRPLFARPGAWRVLDVVVAGVMATLAVVLVV